jgi:hypothetical protein
MTSDQELESIKSISFTELQWQALTGILLMTADTVDGNDPYVIGVVVTGIQIDNLGGGEALRSMARDIMAVYGRSRRPDGE